MNARQAMRLCAAVALLLSMTAAASARPQIRANVLGGYQWGGTASGYEGEIKINSAGNWTVALDIPVQREAYVELSFTRQFSDLVFREYGPSSPMELFGMATEYYHVGGVYTVDRDGPRPFGTMSVGAVRFAPDNNLYDDVWKFSAILGAGILVDIGDRLGIRLQARMFLPFLYSSGGLWCGTGGCSIGIGGGTTIVQGEIAGGITVRF